MQKNKTVYIIGLVVLVAFALMAFGGKKSAPPLVVNKNVVPETLPGIQASTTTWKAELEHLSERLKMIGLPALSEEGSIMHIHQHLDVYINKEHLGIPADIGVNELARYIAPLHTHDATGIIHIESPTAQDFTLGQFFDIWGVRLNKDCVGGYCTDKTHALSVFVNGTITAGNPREVVLKEHQEIVVTYGNESDLPTPIPATYPFEVAHL